MKRGLFSAVLLLALAACGDKAPETGDEPTAESAPPAAEAPPASASASAPETETVIADEELPVAADFEEEVETQITDKNYASELAALEEELAAD